MTEKPEISVILSTYNALEWLRKTLWGYEFQTFQNFEVVIADDGSGKETREFLEELRRSVPFSLTHVWHKDRGFQKSTILNKAILTCKADYILMSDGDCIPRKDFVAVHAENKRPGYFLSGGYFKLPSNISREISREDVEMQRCFELQWLRKRGLKRSFKNKKISASNLQRNVLNFVTPTRATWNGHNSSGWKQDILAVNGFDERMQYGGQDRELGERLFNYGIKSKQIRYSAICLHLHHSREYKTVQSLQKNLKIRKNTKVEKKRWTAFGIEKQLS